jgi:hypothetical protein
MNLEMKWKLLVWVVGGTGEAGPFDSLEACRHHYLSVVVPGMVRAGIKTWVAWCVTGEQIAFVEHRSSHEP